MKCIKKTPDCIRNSWNGKCNAYHRFRKRGLEAKTARELSYRLFLKGARSEHIANRTSNRATRASNNDNICSFLSRLGVKKVRFLIESIRSRFSNLCFPHKRETLFSKNVRKVSWIIKIMKEATWSLHFSCKLATRSMGNNFFAAGSVLDGVFWKS